MSTDGVHLHLTCVRRKEGLFVAREHALGWQNKFTQSSQTKTKTERLRDFVYDTIITRRGRPIITTNHHFCATHLGKMMFQRFFCLFLACVAVSHAFSASSLRQKRHKDVAIVWRADDSDTSTSTTVEEETSTAADEPKMSPVIQQIADERRQYQINLGKAMDVLRRDMQDILIKKPGMCISESRTCAKRIFFFLCARNPFFLFFFF